jgi:hypothetical protein
MAITAQRLCPERTSGFAPPSFGSLGWCSTSCVEAVALRSPIRWQRCRSDGKPGFVEGHGSRQGGLLHWSQFLEIAEVPQPCLSRKCNSPEYIYRHGGI